MNIVLAVLSVGAAILCAMLAIVMLRAAATILRDPGNRIETLAQMGFGLNAFWNGRIPKEGASSEIGVGHGIGGYYDGNRVVLRPEESITGRPI
tara:strand:+ start:3146 stop:3427 length:282 start_codon:yes stop_codon:yes gene_type:complete